MVLTNDTEMMAREKLLRATHNSMSELIHDRQPGPNDDAESEYHDEQLIDAARLFVRETRSRITCTGGDPWGHQGVRIDDLP